jgi:hypothetical protein
MRYLVLILTSNLFLWVSALLYAHPYPPSEAGQKIKIRTEDGVTVVLNPKRPIPQPGGPSQLILTEELVIGKDANAPGGIFGELRSVGVDDRENVWTLDWEDIKVRVFDKTGKLISAFGKQGQGPAEWQNPSRMVVTPDGTGVILDLNKLTFYAADGRCLRELSTAKTNPFRIRLDSKGNIYADFMDFREKLILKLTKHDANLSPIIEIAAVEEPFRPGFVGAFTVLLLFHVTKDDRLVWMMTSAYEFHVLSPKGKLIRRIVKEYEPRKVTADDQNRILKERYGDAPYRPQIVFPATFPPVDLFIGDAEGRLYARTYEPDGKGALWYDVFDTGGRCITRFSLPEDEMAFIVKKDKLYALISENEEGIPLVKRYAMKWK